jgi:hypothetical protein
LDGVQISWSLRQIYRQRGNGPLTGLNSDD